MFKKKIENIGLTDKEVSDKWFKENKQRHYDNTKNWKLKQAYGITLEDYNIMLFEQNGCCAICGTHHLEFNKSLAVDHCHTTGEVRGLLCISCNNGLGRFKDNIETLNNAIKYLTK